MLRGVREGAFPGKHGQDLPHASATSRMTGRHGPRELLVVHRLVERLALLLECRRG
jgi:hypothetical protein